MVPFEGLGTVPYAPIWPYLSPFRTYSASKNDLTLKSGFGVVQGHWRWRGSINHIWLFIGPPL